MPIREKILLLGIGAACGMLLQWGYGKVQAIGSDEPKKVVETYLQQQSSGQYAKALELTSGEARVRLDHLVTNLKPDPLSEVTFDVKAQGKDYSEIEAHIQTQKDTLHEIFYLRKFDSGWKIFSIQQGTQDWETLRPFDLTGEQRKPIAEYVKALAEGRAQDAVNELVGNARVRAATILMNLPKQSISVIDWKGVGHTSDNGVLVELTESISSPFLPEHKERLLYTLEPVGSAWKIADVRLVQ